MWSCSSEGNQTTAPKAKSKANPKAHAPKPLKDPAADAAKKELNKAVAEIENSAKVMYTSFSLTAMNAERYTKLKDDVADCSWMGTFLIEYKSTLDNYIEASQRLGDFPQEFKACMASAKQIGLLKRKYGDSRGCEPNRHRHIIIVKMDLKWMRGRRQGGRVGGRGG